MPKKSWIKTDTLSTLISSLMETVYFGGDNPPLQAAFDDRSSKLLIITGDNASGKSYVRKLICFALKKYSKIEPMHVSQQGRCTEGFMRAFMYGDESYESTGVISCKAVEGGINTCKSRENPHCIIWDEPDIGLSDDYAAGMGVKLREFIEGLPELTWGVVISTHSKVMVQQLVELDPSHLRLGGCPDLKAWLESKPTPKSLEELAERSHAVFRAISGIQK